MTSPNDHKATAEIDALLHGLTIDEREELTLALFEPGDDCAHNMVPVYAEVRRIIAARQAEWEASVLRRCVETMPTTGEAPDFIHTVTTAMLALRPSADDPDPHVHPDTLPCLAGCPAYGTRQGPLAAQSMLVTPAKVAARLCDRCRDEAAGLGSSAPCICGPNVPCEWCGQGSSGITSSPGMKGSDDA